MPDLFRHPPGGCGQASDDLIVLELRAGRSQPTSIQVRSETGRLFQLFLASRFSTSRHNAAMAMLTGAREA